MRFLADENVSALVIARLRSAGFDVVAAGETHSGIPDEAVLAAALAEDRILVTEDRDFGELVIRRGLKLSGVVLLELDRLSATAEAERVGSTVAINSDKLSGNLLGIEPGRVRIRPLG